MDGVGSGNYCAAMVRRRGGWMSENKGRGLEKNGEFAGVIEETRLMGSQGVAECGWLGGGDNSFVFICC